MFRENMDQKITIVHQDPLRLIKAFETHWQLAELLERPVNLVRDSLALARIECSTDHEIVGERCYFAKVQDNYICSFFRFSSPCGGEPIRYLLDDGRSVRKGRI